MSENLQEFTDANFEQEVEKSSNPVLIDFWAVWCMPCRMVAPIVEEIAVEYKDQLKVGKLDVDHNPNTAAKYGIRSIPSLLIINDGKVVDQIVGAVPKKRIVESVQKVVGD